MPKFRKKPVVIEAELASTILDDVGRKLANVPRWVVEAFEQGVIGFELHAVIINTREGQMRGERTDWIIRGVAGELYPCKPDIFQATYEAVEDRVRPEPVATSLPGPGEAR